MAPSPEAAEDDKRSQKRSHSEANGDSSGKQMHQCRMRSDPERLVARVIYTNNWDR